MAPGPHIFGDGRLGVWNINPANLPHRLASFKRFGITDVGLPETAGRGYKTMITDAGLFAFLYVSVAGRSAAQLAADVLAAKQRLGVGAADLNVEFSTDAELRPYMEDLVRTIRTTAPSLRLRLNVAWRKGAFLPAPMVQGDPQLYTCVQNYVDPPGLSMSPTSAADALTDQHDHGIPAAKASVCYGAAGPVDGNTGAQRVCTVPHGGGWVPKRGVIFQDDLMAEVGLL